MELKGQAASEEQQRSAPHTSRASQLPFTQNRPSPQSSLSRQPATA